MQRFGSTLVALLAAMSLLVAAQGGRGSAGQAAAKPLDIYVI